MSAFSWLVVLMAFVGESALADTSQLFVSKAVPGMYVESTSYPETLKTPAAQLKYRSFLKGLQKGFRLLGANEGPPSNWAVCQVTLREWEVGAPTFQVSCLSVAMWDGDQSLAHLNLPDTFEEVMRDLKVFQEMYQLRLARPRPGTGPRLLT